MNNLSFSGFPKAVHVHEHVHEHVNANVYVNYCTVDVDVDVLVHVDGRSVFAPGSTGNENKKILIGKEIVFPGQFESAGFKLVHHLLTGKLHLGGRSDGQRLFFIIDNHNLTAWFEHFLHQPQVIAFALHMVPGVADKEPIDGGVGKQRIVRGRKHRYYIIQLEIPDVPVHIKDHVRADIHRIYAAVASDMPSEPESEVS